MTAYHAQASAPVGKFTISAKPSVRAIPDDLERALRGGIAGRARRVAGTLGDVRLQKQKDGLFAVLESTADRLLLRAVGEQMDLVAAPRNLTKLRVK